MHRNWVPALIVCLVLMGLEASHDAEAKRRGGYRSSSRPIISSSYNYQPAWRAPPNTAESFSTASGTSVALVLESLKAKVEAPHYWGRETYFRALPGIFERKRFSTTLVIHNALPTDANQFRHVFDDSASASATSQMLRSHQDLTDIRNARLLTLRTLKGFVRQLKDNNNKVHVILTHNENGIGALTDGSQVDLRVMAKECGVRRALCIFISCKSAEYLQGKALGMGRDISLRESAALTAGVAKIVADHRSVRVSEPPSVGQEQEITAALVRKLNAYFLRQTISAYAVLPTRAGGAIVAILVIACHNDGNDEQPCIVTRGDG